MNRLFDINITSSFSSKLHGHEIGVAVNNLKGLEQMCRLSGVVEKQFDSHFKINNLDIFLSPSIGFSITSVDVNSKEALLETAYLALNRAKSDPSQVSHMYDISFSQQLHRELLIESELNHALQNSWELEVFYQPKQNILTNEIIGLEALIRWNHPKKGLIYPSEFIHIAEQTRLICRMTNYVLKQVCADLPHLIKHGLLGAVSINTSAKDLARKGFALEVANIAQSYDIPSHYIELEVTEGTLIKDFEQCLFTLNTLRDCGFSLSVDDFGTGYCSLSYLHKLPIDTIKIDANFVQGIEQSDKKSKVISAILQLAHSLNLDVITEGVENLKQKQVLTRIGCKNIQGYLISMPLPLNDTCKLLTHLEKEKCLPFELQS